MPVYICQAGVNSSEPWRHGLQVYAAPFALADAPSDDSHEEHNKVTIAPRMVPTSTEAAAQREAERNNNDNLIRLVQRREIEGANIERTLPQTAETTGSVEGGNAGQDTSMADNQQQHVASLKFGLPVRRIRHAEVVLVDDVCIAYERHWLRLRWPGSKGGFAGYVALGKVNETVFSQHVIDALQLRGM